LASPNPGPEGFLMALKNDPHSLKGHFLIAMPSLMDPNFHQTVTCLCEHTVEGALGLVINRIFPELTGGAVFQELGIDCLPGQEQMPIYIGGPVHKGQIFVLHGPPFHWEGIHPVTDSLALSNSKDILEALARGQGPDFFMITLGCAGWGPGQLESEIMANAWLTCPLEERILFKTPLEQRWEKAARSLGVDVSLLTDAIGHA
jgi:putative transcriptional regulator